MTELKNCPFCGDNNVKPYNLLGRDTDYVVACCNIDCGAEGPDKDTEEAAIKAWNTRVHKVCKCTDQCGYDYCGNCGGKVE